MKHKNMQEYFATVEHIQYLVRQIKGAKLSVPQAFWSTSEKDLRKCYNGIGPDRWSNRFRKLTTSLLEQFEPEALIHDWEYTYAPKTMWHFFVANIRFLYNGIKYAMFCFGASRAALSQCQLTLYLAVLCQLFGWSGYKQTKEDFNEKHSELHNCSNLYPDTCDGLHVDPNHDHRVR